MTTTVPKTEAECQALLNSYRARIEAQLADCLPEADTRLHQAMRYSTLNGGKRIRALLLYTSGECLGAPIEILDIPAVCVELVHSYSLIHDDLPAMDNDDLRRGKPSCHKAFDEATAILAGDALQSLAFELLSQQSPYYDATTQCHMLHTLSLAIGSRGMAGGQSLDMQHENRPCTSETVETIHHLKTAALIRSSVLIGAIAAGNNTHLQPLTAFAEAIGLAFQIRDDVLDHESTTQQLGKTAGSDMARYKATAINTGSSNTAKQRTEALFRSAINHLAKLPYNTNVLMALSRYIINRHH